jgi:hypothetical protein
MPIVNDTLRDVLQVLRLNLEQALNSFANTPDASGDNVVLSNIAFLDGPGNRTPSVDDKLVITLVKTEEEHALKNQPAHRRNPVSGNLEYINPPVYLNLYLMLVANNRNYDNALLFLSRAIGYFQYHSVFNETNSALPPGSALIRFNFNMSMVSPTFEQLNHIWGILGGKQLPSVMYKLQLLEVMYEDTTLPGQEIRTVVVNEKIF